MNEYLEELNKEIKEYFKILSPEFPQWLLEYIDTSEMQRIGKVGMNCGTDYTQLFNNKYFYTRLEHSIGVALIIWNFTKDKKQSLAGLFHDIATPCFSHCIDFLHKDYISQESTEENTRAIIENSKEIIKLLQRDNIKIDEIYDYKIYPIADNNTPKLSADRLEYTLSSGITFTKQMTLDEIRKIYNNLEVQKNEENILELGFKDKKIAEEFVSKASVMWNIFKGNRDKIVMQFWADLIKYMINKNIIEEADLYRLPEKEIVKIVENCKIKHIEEVIKNFKNANSICEGEIPPKDNYFIGIEVKKRYINPLVNGTRLSKISKEFNDFVYEFLNSKPPKYAWFKFKVCEELYSE